MLDNNRPLRIGFLTSEYVTEENFSGGLAHYLHRVVKGLQDRGHEAEVFALSDRGETISFRGIPVHRVRSSLKWAGECRWINRCHWRVRKLFWKVFVSSHRALWDAWALDKRFRARHRQKPFDLVQVPNYLSVGFFLTLRPPVPIVGRISSYRPLWNRHYGEEMDWDRRLMERMELSTLKRCNALYAPSRLLADTLKRSEGIAVEVLAPPFYLEEDQADYSTYKERCRGFEYLLFFGSIGLLKGGGVLAEALPRAMARCPDLHFVFAGKSIRAPNDGGDMMQTILERAGEFRNRVHYLGILRHDRLYPVVERARGVVLPSLVDNLPNTCLEAMAHGRVVIGTMGTSFEELIENGRSGFLVSPGDPQALSEAMVRLWTLSPGAREQMGALAKERTYQLSPDYVMPRLEEFYKSIALRESP